jgi:hypothetical protein
VKKRVKVRGFGEVAIGSETIRFIYQIFGVGGCQHNHNDTIQLAAFLDETENGSRIDFGEMVIEKDEGGARGGGKIAGSGEKMHGLFPVFGDVDTDWGRQKTECFPDQANISWIIFGDQNFLDNDLDGKARALPCLF